MSARALEAGRVYQGRKRVTSFEINGGGVMTAAVRAANAGWKSRFSDPKRLG
jgi:hypothetical protein